MKRLFIGLITCVTYFVGCTEVYVGLNPEDILNISVNSIDIGCEGGNTEVIVESMCAWKIDTKDCSWATIDTKIGDKGKSKLTITVLENTTFDKRTATFSIGDYNRDIQRDIIITQDANTPNLELSTTSIEASMDGSAKSVTVKSNVSITVSSSEKWCTVDKTTLSRGNNQVKISIERNNDTESRSAIVTFGNEEYDIMREIEIVQEALEPNLELSTTSIEASMDGITKSVSVKSNVSITVSSSEEWCTVDKTTLSRGNNQVKISIEHNNDTESRSAIVTFGNEEYDIMREIEIIQEALEPNLELSTTSIEASMDGDTKSVTVKSSVSITVSSSEEWCTVDKTTLSRGNNQINISIEHNHTTQSRSAIVTLSNEEYDIMREIEIIQEALEPNLELSTTSIEASMDGVTKSVSVKSNVSITVSSSEEWCTVDKTTLSRGDNQINISIEYNHSTESRSAIVTLSNEEYDIMREIEVVQEALEPNLELSTTSIEASMDGDTKSVSVKSNVSITVSSSEEWCTVDKTTLSRGNNQINISIEYNHSTESRSAIVTLSNEEYDITREIEIIQEASTPDITVDMESLSISGYGAIEVITIQSNISWIASCDLDWISLSRSDGEIGSTILSINISRNDTGNIRQGSVILSNDEYQVYTTIIIEQESLYVMYYTALSKVTPYNSRSFNVNILDNIWEDGKGEIFFNGPITYIGKDAFRYCDNLTSITIPNSVTWIGEYAFFSCNDLESITIPNSVTWIENHAFCGCDSLTNITISNSINWIQEWTFSQCNSLTSITIPSGVKTISDHAFFMNDNLTSIYCMPITPPKNISDLGGYWDAFDDNAKNRKIYVPRESVEAYKSAIGWKDYASAIVGYDF